MDEQPQPAPGRNLPAPYQNPWMLLGRDLGALLATARLRGWELARRNRQGDLAVPGFWPRALSPWFWPLVLSLALAVLVALPVLLAPGRPGRSPQVQRPQQELREDQPDGEPRSAPELAPELPPEPGSEPPVQPAPAAAASPESPAETLAEAAAIDPLLALLQPADPRGLIRAVREQPARGCLELELAEGFAALAPERQGQQAEAWRGRALELGYERLELTDGSGRLLGRTARVGSGMILLNPAAAAPDAP